MLAVQADGRSVETVESLAAADGKLSVLQQAFIAISRSAAAIARPAFS
jgi:aerobic-type carbon monoxide dehydrogenase small subunit (CoxS/CutS family)